MQGQLQLTPTSYIVLGLVDQAAEATPYDLKRMVAASVGNFWSLQHAQLYSEPARLAAAGLLSETREEGGRRRKRYSITQQGRRALRDWLGSPTEARTELRDPGVLKLFFGADPAELAVGQLEMHRAKLAEYEGCYADSAQDPPGVRLSLEAGIAHERQFIQFWKRMAKGGGA